MTVERSKRRSYFLSLVFITKCFSKNLLVLINRYKEMFTEIERLPFRCEKKKQLPNVYFPMKYRAHRSPNQSMLALFEH